MNIKRMEVMLGDLSESFDRHVSSSVADYYFVLSAIDGMGKLRLRLYSQGGNAQLEILAFALAGSQTNFSVEVDGKTVDERSGEVSIAPLALARGWRVVEITGRGLSSGRVRISGNISNASVLAE
ncbi:MAG: hypothetical protein K2L70_00390 [Clostridia bacterium]|nr:hypothetical protein [Clostridia bacterium]